MEAPNTESSKEEIDDDTITPLGESIEEITLQEDTEAQSPAESDPLDLEDEFDLNKLREFEELENDLPGERTATARKGRDIKTVVLPSSFNVTEEAIKLGAAPTPAIESDATGYTESTSPPVQSSPTVGRSSPTPSKASPVPEKAVLKAAPTKGVATANGRPASPAKTPSSPSAPSKASTPVKASTPSKATVSTKPSTNAQPANPAKSPASPSLKSATPASPGAIKQAPKKTTAPPKAKPISINYDEDAVDLSSHQLTVLPKELIPHTHLETLTLTNNHLTSFPKAPNLNPTIRVLNLNYNKIEVFPPTLMDLVQLENLDVSGNRISSFPADLSGFKNLSELNLSHCGLVKIPMGIVKISQLKKLTVELNNLTEFPPEMSKLGKLEVVSASLNKIKDISNLCGLPLLRELDLTDNKIENLPADLPKMSSLTSLNLENNLIKTFGEALGKTSSIAFLSLKGNGLSSIPGGVISNMKKLRDLNLNDNQIASIPVELCKLPELQVLSVTANQISELPAAVSSLKKLAVLRIGFNKLKSIPEQLTLLTGLEEINIGSNQITALPAGIAKLPQLFDFFAGYNQIANLPLENDQQLQYLDKLFISGNPIKKFPVGLPKLKRITELYASNIGLTELPVAFPSLKYLQKVDLSHNQITVLPGRLREMMYIVSLNLSHNKIEKLDPAMVNSWNRLQELDLSHNLIKEVPQEYRNLYQYGVEVMLDNNPLTEQVATSIVDSNRYKVGWAEMIGRRPNMEDAFVIQGNYEGNAKLDLYGVYDGHAGSLAARYCRQHIPGMLSWLRSNRSEHSVTEHLKALYNKFNIHFKTFLDKQLPNQQYCGSTALTLLITDKTIHIANLGDTRAVLSRKGSAVCLSVDHKPADVQEEERIKALGGNIMGTTVRRVNGILGVSRAVGDFYMKPFVSADPFVDEIAMTADDEFLILACDGIWDEIGNQEAVDIVRGEPDPFKASAKLRDCAYLRGSDDNISVMVVRLKA
eukprot:TRINITY_DN3422_c0_g1_i3.p1 TRINITY_DN3422_c0_g1~~TRINITY_DN3422_c0_g1_i3.p1  ORF type:complete len:988 (-),score=346.47 TRINITY_DN3422_c0_g1_i3:57-3020(-)